VSADERQSTVIKDLACLRCHAESVRVATMTARFVYLRCDGCGELFAMSERRGSWPHAFPSPTPLMASLRRTTDAQDPLPARERRRLEHG
jgi:hypothetical protein